MRLLRTIFVTLPVLLLVMAPRFAFADECQPGQLCNPLAFRTLPELLVAFLDLIIRIGFPIVVLFIVYIGFQFVRHSAEGNSDELANDRKNILWAIVGALILLGAQALAFGICQTLVGVGASVSCGYL